MSNITTTVPGAHESADTALELRTAVPADADTVARIIHEAFAGIHDRHRFPRDFPTLESASQLASAFIDHPAIWGVVATQEGRVVGSNFLGERDPIRGVGPITVDPTVQTRGVGRQLMEAVMERGAEAAGVRLLQDAFNSQSMGLYTDLGFVTREPIALVAGRVGHLAPSGLEIRPMSRDDLGACAELNVAVHGFPRTNELRDALDHPALSPVVGLREGRIVAYASGVGFFAASFGTARTEADMFALITGSLAADQAPASFLLPTMQTTLFRGLLTAGLRVVKPMTYMTLGAYHEPDGAWFPSVLY